MAKPTSQTPRLQATGALREDALYVERSADEVLFAALSSGEFCAVLAPRQIGKSSLRARTARRLKEVGVHCAQIDLTSLGRAADRDPIGAWYFSLAHRLADELDLSDPKPFFEQHAALLPADRLGLYLRRQVVPALTGTIVVFLDEIDYVRALPIDRDEFFVALRALYNERPQTPALERLTFCLLGVAAPRDLVRDPHITPFNIGRAIRLLDFSRTELSAFSSVLSSLDGESTRWLDEIYRWTSGHPYMTQALCQEVLRRKAETGTVSERVERAAQARFLRVGRASDENLSYAEKRLDQSPQKAELLILYRKLLAGDAVLIDTGDPVQQELMMCGMAAPAPRDQSIDGPHTLAVRNDIFARVFDPVWVREKEAQRLLTTGFRRWEEAGQRDSDLLTGSALQEAQAFAKEHPRELTSQEHEFLLRCLDGVRRQAEQAQLLSEASLAKERLERAEHDRKTQRRIIFGLVVFIVLLLSAGLSLFLLYRNAQSAQRRERQARIEAQELAQREAQARQNIEELVQKNKVAVDRAEKKEKEAEAAQSDARAAEARYQTQTQLLQTQTAKAEQAQKEALEKEARVQQKSAEVQQKSAELDASRLNLQSETAARLAASPANRWMALVQGLRAVSSDVKSGQFHPVLWEGLTAAAIPIVGSKQLPINVQERGTTAVMSPNRQQVAVGTASGEVLLFDANTGKRLWRVQPHTRPVFHLAFSRNHRFVASSSLDQKAQVLDALTGEVIQTTTVPRKFFYADFVGNTANLQISEFPDKPDATITTLVNKDAFPIGRSFPSTNNPALPYYDRKKSAIVSPRLITTLPNSSDWVSNLAIDTKRRLIALDAGEKLSLVAAQSGKLLWLLDGERFSSNSLQFVDDGQLLFAYSDEEMRLFDLSQVIGRSWDSSARYLSHMASDGRLGVSRSGNALDVVELRTGKTQQTVLLPLATRPRVDISWKAKLSEKGESIWSLGRLYRETHESVGGELRGWKLPGMTPVYSAHWDQPVELAVSGDAEVYFVATNQKIDRVQIPSGIVLNTFAVPPDAGKRDGKAVPVLMVSDLHGRRLLIAAESGLYVLDTATGAILTRFGGGELPTKVWLPNSVFAPDGQAVLFRLGRELQLGNVADGTLRVLRGHLGSIYAMSFSHEGRQIVSAGADKTVRIWDAATGTQQLVLPTDELVRHLAFVDGGQNVMAVQANGVARLLPTSHRSYLFHACRVLRDRGSVTGISDAEVKEALAVCPADGK